jgi:transcription termination/antitermination protein NusG
MNEFETAEPAATTGDDAGDDADRADQPAVADARRRAELMGDRLADTETDEAADLAARAEAGDEAADLALRDAGGPVPLEDADESATEPLTETAGEALDDVEAQAEASGDPELERALDITDVPTPDATEFEAEAERSLAADIVEGQDEGPEATAGPDPYLAPEQEEVVERPATPEESEAADAVDAGEDADEAAPRADASQAWVEPEAEDEPVTLDEAAASSALEEAEEPSDGRPDPFRGPGDWYVIHTYAGYENKVKANLGSRISSMQMEDKIFDVVIPMEDVMEIKGGKKQVVQKKVFPGYLLVKMIYDNDSWYVVRNTPGVTGFVSSGTGSKPTPLSTREVEKILAVKPETKVKPQYRLEWEEGDVVRIIAGPFADFTGTIAEINVEQSKLKVMVNIFDRETPVELAFDQVAKA